MAPSFRCTGQGCLPPISQRWATAPSSASSGCPLLHGGRESPRDLGTCQNPRGSHGRAAPHPALLGLAVFLLLSCGPQGCQLRHTPCVGTAGSRASQDKGVDRRPGATQDLFTIRTEEAGLWVWGSEDQQGAQGYLSPALPLATLSSSGTSLRLPAGPFPTGSSWLRHTPTFGPGSGGGDAAVPSSSIFTAEGEGAWDCLPPRHTLL